MDIFWKLFWRSGVPFGILIGISQIIFRNSTLTFFYGSNAFAMALVFAVVAGLFYAFFMAALITFFHKRAVQNLGYGTTEEAFEVHHVRNVDLTLPYSTTFDLCIGGLHLMGGFSIQEEDRSSGEINAKAGRGFLVKPNQVTFHIKSVNDLLTHVEVSSKPLSRWAVVDFGKNLENVERIVGYLRSHSIDSSKQMQYEQKR